MSNYRRLISYIYAYEGGVKGKNIGFAKIETRGIQCKITVSVKRIYVGGNDIGVYLLAGEKEIYLGNIFIRGGSGEFRATVSENDIERSGINMDQCFGLTIHDVKNTWRSYTTIWEDAVAHAAEVDLEHTDSAVKDASAISEEQIKKAVQEIEKEFPLEGGGSQYTKRMPLKTESLKSQEEENLLQTESSVSTGSKPSLEDGETEISREDDTTMPEIRQMTGFVPEGGNTGNTVTGPTPTAPMTAESVLTDQQADAAVQRKQDTIPLMPKPIMAETEDAGLKETLQMSSNISSLAENSEVFSEPNAGTTRLYRADAVIKEAKNQNQIDPKLGDPEALEQLRQRENLEENLHSVVWDRLSKEHTRMLAFDYEDGCEILTIKPQDIGILPRDAWVYGNNSFLLHGYYNYRYLILAKLFNPEGTPRYLLGIPGHYYSNERYMASMFGFPNFVLSKDQPMEDGRFGFWYTDIKIGG